MQPFDGDNQWLLYPGVNSTFMSSLAEQGMPIPDVMQHSQPSSPDGLPQLGPSFFPQDETQTCANVYSTCEQKGQQWQIVGKNCFPVEENADVNYFRYVTEYSIAFARSSVIWMCVCVLCGSPWPLLQAVPCPGHESSTGKNVLSDSMPPNTPKHTASS